MTCGRGWQSQSGKATWAWAQRRVAGVPAHRGGGANRQAHRGHPTWRALLRQRRDDIPGGDRAPPSSVRQTIAAATERCGPAGGGETERFAPAPRGGLTRWLHLTFDSAAASLVDACSPAFMNSAALTTIAATGFTVAFFHAAIPTHWLPFVLVARARQWSRTKTLLVTVFAGFGAGL